MPQFIIKAHVEPNDMETGPGEPDMDDKKPVAVKKSQFALPASPKGPPGPKGPKGPTSPKGPQGPKGPKGPAMKKGK